jgi:OmcA/MtrC family decaheme c-type cytochrome
MLISADGPQFTVHDKAYYADANLVNFVRPGLVTDVYWAAIADDGTIRARFKITDPRGLGLDRGGVTTPGTISISLIAAYIPKGKTQYVAYTTRTQTSPITNVSAIQAAGESNGTFTKLGEGDYEYVFRAKAPAGFDKTATHSIGAYSSRNLTEFDLGTNYDDDVYAFVPDGTAPQTVRDVIKTETCNRCHDPLALHGGSRRSMELCVLCHTPQTSDPDTGNTVDMPVMTHKIHMGEHLPSVQAGTPYQIIGFQQSVHDYSEVVFPAGALNCTHCHEQGKGAAQEDAYLKPNRAACGACHDNVDFATGKDHASLPQISDNQCANCHTVQGEVEFDISIMGAHLEPRFSSYLPGTVLEILAVDNAAPGQKPNVSFSVKDKSGAPIQASAMSRLALVFSGPTSDYSIMVTEDARKAACTDDGRCVWTANWTIPADAKGTYSVGIEGYRNITLLPGTEKEQVVRDAGVNKVMHFSVDGSPVEPRRQVVAIENCNQCHMSLTLHGFNRNQIEQCVLCHNPMITDTARRPADDQPPQSIDFRMMIHKIHTGEELTYDYSVYGFGNVKHNYNKVLYPGDRRNCGACHVNDSEQLPLGEKLIKAVDPRGYLNPVSPTTAACTGCHTSIQAASHALVNTTELLGESCSVCHGPNADFSVNRSHAR